jgi:hypothetical protein
LGTSTLLPCKVALFNHHKLKDIQTAIIAADAIAVFIKLKENRNLNQCFIV